MTSITGVLEHPAVYRLWQGPFIDSKLAPLRRHNDLNEARRVLDVGCGPGTKARKSSSASTTSAWILSPEYVAYARRRYGDRFAVVDVRDDPIPGEPLNDLILVNSLFHHLDTETVPLDAVGAVTTPERRRAHFHIIDLELPEAPRFRAVWPSGTEASSPGAR